MTEANSPRKSNLRGARAQSYKQMCNQEAGIENVAVYEVKSEASVKQRDCVL
jgi:hypothetical protein